MPKKQKRPNQEKQKKEELQKQEEKIIKIVPTSIFAKAAKKLTKLYKSFPTDLENFTKALQKNPQLGEPLGKNLYKLRMAVQSKQRGKSGGIRVITVVFIQENKVYLLTAYNKSDISSMETKELIELAEETGLF